MANKQESLREAFSNYEELWADFTNTEYHAYKDGFEEGWLRGREALIQIFNQAFKDTV